MSVDCQWLTLEQQKTFENTTISLGREKTMEIRNMLFSTIQTTNNLLRKINERNHSGTKSPNFENILTASSKKKISQQAADSNPSTTAVSHSNQGNQVWSIDFGFAKSQWEWLQQPVAYTAKNPKEAQIVKNIQEMRKNLTVEEIAKCSSSVNTCLNGNPVQVPLYVLFAPEWIIIGMANGTFTPVDY